MTTDLLVARGTNLRQIAKIAADAGIGGPLLKLSAGTAETPAVEKIVLDDEGPIEGLF